MILDGSLQFDPPNTPITAGGASTNVLDMSAMRDMGPGFTQLDLLVLCQATFVGPAAATLNVQLQGAPDNGSGAPGGYTLIEESGAIPIGMLAAGMKLFQSDLGAVSQGIVAPPVNTTITTTNASTSATVASAAGILQGMMVSTPGVVPGTTVASISGTTVTLSQAAAASGAGVAASFLTALPKPRFYRLNYVVASGPFTAGQVQSQLVLQREDPNYYPPGVVVAN